MVCHSHSKAAARSIVTTALSQHRGIFPMCPTFCLISRSPHEPSWRYGGKGEYQRGEPEGAQASWGKQGTMVSRNSFSEMLREAVKDAFGEQMQEMFSSQQCYKAGVSISFHTEGQS